MPFEIEMMDAAELAAHPQNFRRHPMAQVKQIDRSLKEFGWLQNVVWNRRTGYILNGHARIDLAAKRNEKVPVRVIDVDSETERRILLALDRTGEGATVDEEVLLDLLREVTEVSGDLPPGWAEKDLEKLLEAQSKPEGDEEEDLDLPAETGTEGEFEGPGPLNVPLSSIRLVQLFLTQELETRFRDMCLSLSNAYGTQTITDTVFTAVERAFEELPDADRQPDLVSSA